MMGLRQAPVSWYCGFLTFETKKQRDLFCTQGRAHSCVGSATKFGCLDPGRGQAQVLSTDWLTQSYSRGPGFAQLGESTSALFCEQGTVTQGFSLLGKSLATSTELSLFGGSFLPQFFDEGHLIPIPDTIISELFPVLCELFSRRD